MYLAVAILLSFLAGSWLGASLAKRGLTADNALQKHQQQVYWISAIVLGIGTLVAVLMVAGQRSPWVPSFLLLYLGAYFWDAVLLLCCFCAGLLLLLERSGWNDRTRLQQLLLFLTVSLSAVIFLLWQGLPITGLVEAPRMTEGVVLQTTPYSCAAATIATLARQVRPARQTTEQDVVKLAGTSRQGTNTLSEIYAMEQLGLAPDYRRNLTIAELVDRKQMAVLHVMEPVGNKSIQHAIALLAIDPNRKELMVANPLIGKQIKTFDSMKDYWLGEAVFVTVSPTNH
ncbi:MAG: cysteine peptidase family C39 domain-containing protein [Leptolyngbya sp. BL-A-14]